MPLGTDILHAEIAAARIEAVLQSDPAIGRLWRAEAAIVEAVRSVGLEDFRIRESDLLLRISENRAADIDARGVESAYTVLRHLNRAGATQDPAGLILAAGTQVISAPDPVAGPVQLSRADVLDILSHGAGPSMSPLIGALRSAARYALVTERQSPVLERLVFTSVEAGLRARPEDTDHEVEEDPLLQTAPTGGWIMLPATALTTDGFSLWSPLSLEGVEKLVAGIRKSLSREIGRIGPIRAWLGKAAALEGFHRRGSRFPDLVKVITRRPLITSARLAEDLAATPRTATNLLNEAVSQGLLVELTMRRYARIWSTPGLALLLADKPRPGHSPSMMPTREPAMEPAKRIDPPHDPEVSSGLTSHERQTAPVKDMDEAYSEFDALMAEADEMLRTIGKTRRDREENLGISS